MATITRGRIERQLEEGLNAVFGMEYDDYQAQWSEVFMTESSKKAKEEEVLMSGLGLAATKTEGQSTVYDDMGEKWVATYVHETISLGFQITEEALEDNLYVSLSKRGSKALARSFKQTKEIKGAAVLNNGFSTFLTGDGKALFTTDHPTSSADFANEPATPSQFSEAALEEALIDISKFEDDRGLLINAKAEKIIFPTDLQFVAKRVLMSDKLPGTGDNDMNPVRSIVPYVVNNYLTSTTAWFILTNVSDGFKMFQRTPMKRGLQGEFDTGSVRYKGRERYVFGVSDPRAGYANPGA